MEVWCVHEGVCMKVWCVHEGVVCAWRCVHEGVFMVWCICVHSHMYTLAYACGTYTQRACTCCFHHVSLLFPLWLN